MTREEAIEKLAKEDFNQLTNQQKLEQIEIMTLEDWTDAIGWDKLKKSVQDEIESGDIYNSDPNRYENALMIWLRYKYLKASNAYLETKLGVEKITGVFNKLIPCPCCGIRTLSERGIYQICKVCWWEDDGQDNSDANEIMGGPNYGISLTQGRVNFILSGLYDPKREDLLKLKEPKSKYEVGRIFKITSNSYIMELNTEWCEKIESK